MKFRSVKNHQVVFRVLIKSKLVKAYLLVLGKQEYSLGVGKEIR